MRSWAAGELVPRIGATSQVTYMFGGPDLVSALALFPEAKLYALGGLEPVGKLTNPLSLSPEELHASLAMLRKSTEVIMNFSHFITKDMKTELAASHFQGVFPIMLVFLSFTDARIDLAERLTLQRDGTLAQGESSGGQPALRIVFRSAPGMPQAEVIYLQANLSDGALKSNPGILEWLRSRGRATGYLKAASYLMHTGGFTTIRDNQPALRSLYEGGTSFSLPFGFGYRWQRGESTLLIALPPEAAPRALPAHPTEY
jgi:hypothetical protein